MSVETSVVSRASPALTRLPEVSSARPTRPSMGAVTRVKDRSSWALSSCAWIAATADFASLAALTRASASSAEIAFFCRRRSPRSASATVRCWVARACCSCACRRLTSAWNGRGSIWNKRSPFFTSAPSSKATLSMKPDTRGRISTDSGASRRPVSSSHSVTGCSMTSATLTAGGGMPDWVASGALPQAAVISTATAMRGKRKALSERSMLDSASRIC